MPRTPQHSGQDMVVRALDTIHKLDVIYTDEHGNPDGGKHAEALLKRRRGDQPLPIRSTSPDISDLVVVDLEARKKVGISRYGRALQAHNGRDAMRDAYEEALDLCNYLRQMIYERDGK